MAIFFHADVRELLSEKKVVVIGDSIQRSVYKDLVCLWTQEDSRYLHQRELRAKGELSFLEDRLLSGGKLDGKMVNGTGYREVREFKEDNTVFKYYFVTRCYSEHVASVLNELKTYQPDVIVMNSTFWDIHHYGDNDLQQYKENLNILLKGITEMFSSRALFIWNAALPLADKCKGGFLRKGFLTIPLEKIKAANKLAWLASGEHKKVYLDLFSQLGNNGRFTQAEDGIHWGMRAHRKISNLVLTEICRAWNKKIPDPPPLPSRTECLNSPAEIWASYYPDSEDVDDWNQLPMSYSDGYDDLEYWNYVGYQSSPVCDGFRSPSPVLYREASPYDNNWGSFGWGYHSPYTNSFSSREREYTPIQNPFPSFFQKRYSLPLREYDFGTPIKRCQTEPFAFKYPAYYSDPLPARAYQFSQFDSVIPKRQGLLPTPSFPPMFSPCTEFIESNNYRDRFKKLSKPTFRARRGRAALTANRALQNQTESVANKITSNVPSEKKSNESKESESVSSDLNNNKEGGVSIENNETVKLGGAPINVAQPQASSADTVLLTEKEAHVCTAEETRVAMKDLHEEMLLEQQSKSGVKRKREEESSEPSPSLSKMAREESPTDIECGTSPYYNKTLQGRLPLRIEEMITSVGGIDLTPILHAHLQQNV